MNAAYYIFVENNLGELIQYPDDSTSSVFSRFIAHATSKQTIAIHRDGDLMYYGYIRQWKGGESFGICFVLNGVMISDIPRKFTYRPNYISQLFEDAINAIAETHTLIYPDKKTGDIELYDGIKEIFSVYAGIESKLNSLLEQFSKLKLTTLPPPSYKTPKGYTKDYQYNDDWNDILQSCHTNDYTYISVNPEQPAQTQELLSASTSEDNDDPDIYNDLSRNVGLFILIIGASLILFALIKLTSN